MTQGTVKFYHGQRGYGFIQPVEGGPDVFVHVTNLAGSGTALSEGQRVTFEVGNTRDGRSEAANVRLI
jgi:CspA family cold shock protein